MTTSPVIDPQQLLRDMQRELKHQRVNGRGIDPQLAMLRMWQCERLTRTYYDFLTSPQYAPICGFFLTDIYGPRDFTQRNHDVERLHDFLARVVPAPMLQLLTDTVILNRMTDGLDEALLRALVDDLGVTDSITAAQYAEAYRLCDNYDERVQQIELVHTIVQQVGEGAKLGIVWLALKVLKGPAHQAGWTQIYDFAERGYSAVRRAHDIKTFVNAIRQRERRVLDQIYDGASDPFSLG